jgi:hypothetical protein
MENPLSKSQDQCGRGIPRLENRETWGTHSVEGDLGHPPTHVYRKSIKISREDMTWLQSGRKKCTIRMGNASVDGTEIQITDGRTSVPVRIVKVEHGKCFRDLGENEARDEGFDTCAELITDLKKYYPRADASDPVTIIYFEPLNSTLSLFGQ